MVKKKISEKKSSASSSRHKKKTSSRKISHKNKQNKMNQSLNNVNTPGNMQNKEAQQKTEKKSFFKRKKDADSSKKPEQKPGFWYIKDCDEVLDELGSSRNGISDEDAERKLKEVGPNAIAREDRFKWWKSLIDKVNSLIIYVLFAAGVISYIFDHPIEFYVIMIIIFLTVFMGFIQEYSASKSIEALSKLTAKKVEILRAGKRKEIFSANLVPGDIVLLQRGMLVPADLRVIESKAVTVDESILTGESVLKHKIIERLEDQHAPLSDRDNMVFSGSSITGGFGRGVVVETGFNSELGKISMQLKTIGDHKSPIQKKIHVMSKNISYGVIVVAVLFYFLLMFNNFETFESLLLVAAVVVSGIPESFPLVLTLALSNGVKRMAQKNAIVKDLSSVETLGTTTVICTDKTGTLTENKMCIQKAFITSSEEFDIEGKGYEPISKFSKSGKKADNDYLKKYEDFFHACILCSNAELLMDSGEWSLKGEPTEGSLLTLAKSVGYDDIVLREEHPRIYEIPFDPKDKFMISVNESTISKKVVHNAYLKGAVEKVLDKCTHTRLTNGKISKLSTFDKRRIMNKVEEYSSSALRVLAVATKTLPKRVSPNANAMISKAEMQMLDKGYVFEAIVGIEDPIRADVYDAVNECAAAGVMVKIVTGDHVATAEAIGKKLGIVKGKEDKIMPGSELENLDDSELDEIIKDVVIFARTTPEHKLRIVQSLQRIGEIVAMTGDGVNDAPALKKADIGVSMGKGGTEVARESSNLILADDNFATIVSAIREGRTIYSNIRRIIYYLLTMNFTQVSLIIFAIFIGFQSPLTPLMILFVNMVTSMFPSMALSFEPTHHKVMNQLPRNPKERLLSNYMIAKIVIIMPVFFIGTFMLFFWSSSKGDVLEMSRAVAFSTLVMFGMVHVFNAKSLHTTIFTKGMFNNKLIFWSISLSVLLLILSIYVPFGQEIFGTVAMPSEYWITIILVSLLGIIVSEMVKLMIKLEIDEQRNLQGVDVKLQ